MNGPGILNYINHSCNPNSLFKIGNAPKLIALKDIYEGEEITCDYSETEKGGKKLSVIVGVNFVKAIFIL